MNISTPSHHHISSFFESYARALEHSDTKLMAFHYFLPCTMLDDESSVIFTEASKLEGLFNQGVGFYKQYGVVHALPEVWNKRQLSAHIAQAKVKWQYLNEGRELLYTCDYHYILRHDKQGAWKIQVVVSVNEKQRMEAWLRGRK